MRNYGTPYYYCVCELFPETYMHDCRCLFLLAVCNSLRVPVTNSLIACTLDDLSPFFDF